MKVYLSGTYKDLVEHRKAASEQLRRMRHDVVGMEDYVAADQRPLDKCLSDLSECDVYVGIFALRYGFVPKKNNPQHRSITELEYRKAKQLKMPCLLFLLKEDAPWSAVMMDSYTGDGDGGARIKELRDELANEHLVSFFQSPDQLGGLTAAAIFGIGNGADMKRTPAAPIATKRHIAPGRAKPRTGYKNLWRPGSVLRICFLDHNAAGERAVQRFLPLWSVYGNVQFEFTDAEDAEVRVSFKDTDANWSYVGTECIDVPLAEPTMNLGFVEPPELVVLHEFGHVLGLQHEHNHPKGIQWNKRAVYKSMTGAPNFWDKATVDQNMFQTWQPDTYPVQKPFDPISVMAYPMPKAWMRSKIDFGNADSLSKLDKQFIGQLYPYK